MAIDDVPVCEYHQTAMAVAELGILAQAPDVQRILARTAASLEHRAFKGTPEGLSPTREVLFRSFLNLLEQAGLYQRVLREAEASGYHEWAHPEIAVEIDDVVSRAREALRVQH